MSESIDWKACALRTEERAERAEARVAGLLQAGRAVAIYQPASRAGSAAEALAWAKFYEVLNAPSPTGGTAGGEP